MKLQHLIYDDDVIRVGLVTPSGTEAVCLAIRWLPPRPIHKEGVLLETTNYIGGATDWFVVPSTFGAAIGRNLVEQRAASNYGFDDEGFAALVRWLIENGGLQDAMCY